MHRSMRVAPPGYRSTSHCPGVTRAPVAPNQAASAVCTVILLIRPDHAWPLVLAANRDERLDRAWEPPAAHWPDHPDVVAGRDRTGGGTWMGLNSDGVVATVLNRQGSLGPAPGKRSRGELPLIALYHSTAAKAAQAVAAQDAGEWRSFNLVAGGRHRGGVRARPGPRAPPGHSLTPGLHMITSRDPDDPESPRVARHLARFVDAVPPRPGDWRSWQTILADFAGQPGEQLNVVPRSGYGTVCSSLLALPKAGPPIWRFAAGPPNAVPFRRVRLPWAAEPPE